MARRQSQSQKDIVGTDTDVKLPSGPTAGGGVSGVRYFDAPVDDGQSTEQDNPNTGIINQLPAPRDLQIESQEIGFTPEGNQVITVVISFETTDEAESHQVRIAKA